MHYICSFIQKWAGLAQLVEHRFCKPTVVGSSPITSSIYLVMARFPSGQREQTVNLPAMPSKVRVLLSPPFFYRFNGLDGLKD